MLLFNTLMHSVTAQPSHLSKIPLQGLSTLERVNSSSSLVIPSNLAYTQILHQETISRPNLSYREGYDLKGLKNITHFVSLLPKTSSKSTGTRNISCLCHQQNGCRVFFWLDLQSSCWETAEHHVCTQLLPCRSCATKVKEHLQKIR